MAALQHGGVRAWWRRAVGVPEEQLLRNAALQSDFGDGASALPSMAHEAKRRQRRGRHARRQPSAAIPEQVKHDIEQHGEVQQHYGVEHYRGQHDA